MLRLAAALPVAIALAGCGWFGDDRAPVIAAIGPVRADPNPLLGELSPGNQALLAATAGGLVRLAGDGQIDVGLAERWTITGDGRSYIFRLQAARWRDGQPVTTSQVARILTNYLRSPAHMLSGNFPEVETIRAMTDHVIEIRLSAPQPHLLELLAHPAMAIARDGQGWGPMTVKAAGRGRFAIGALASDDDAAAPPVRSEGAVLHAADAAAAVGRYRAGLADGVIGGTQADFAVYLGSKIARSDLIVNPVPGLFGLSFVAKSGAFATDVNRDALAMAIDPARVIGGFGLAEWRPQSSLRLTENLRATDRSGLYPSWIDLPMPDRLSRARAIFAAYRGSGGELPAVRIAMPPGPGSRIIFAWIAADLRQVGLTAVRVDPGQPATLQLIDVIAPYDDPIWAFRRLNCRRDTLCSPDVTRLLRAAEQATSADDRTKRIADAEAVLVRQAGYIPLATPLRWSLRSSRLPGLRANSQGFHPMTALGSAGPRQASAR